MLTVIGVCDVPGLDGVSSPEGSSVMKIGISGLVSVGRTLGVVLLGAFAITAPIAAYAQDESPRRDERPRTQQDILKESERAQDRTIQIPLFGAMTAHDLDHVADALAEACRRCGPHG